MYVLAIIIPILGSTFTATYENQKTCETVKAKLEQFAKTQEKVEIKIGDCVKV